MKRRFLASFLTAVAFSSTFIFCHGGSWASDSLTIQGDRTGRVSIRDIDCEEMVREFDMGPGVIRETFLLQEGEVAVASQAHRANFWNVHTGELIRSIDERIYAFTPDESLFITFIPDSAGGLFLRETDTAELKAKLYDGVWGGPYRLVISPNGSFLAVEFGNAYPLRDEDYPVPGILQHGRYWVELFDLNRGVIIDEFRQHPSRILGRFGPENKYYYLRNPDVLLDGTPFDEGLRFDLQELRWEPTERMYPSKESQDEGNYDISAEIDGVSQKIATVTVHDYHTYEEDLSVGVEIRASFSPQMHTPSCCLQYWQFVAHDDWPVDGSSLCPGEIVAPFVDTPIGGYEYGEFDTQPRYNEQYEGQTELYDRPSISKINLNGSIHFESSVGIEGGKQNTRTYTIPGNSAAFQWGFDWDLLRLNVEKKPLEFSTISGLDRSLALTHSCFTGWTVSVGTPVNPCIELYSPTANNVAHVGPFTSPKNFDLEVLVGPAFFREQITGLSANDFDITIGEKPAKVVQVTELEKKYILEIQPPNRDDGIPQNGLYGLEINCVYDVVGLPDDATNFDTEPDAVLYSDVVSADIIPIIDRSGSMGTSGYIGPAKSAASQFVSYMNPNDQVGVVSFSSSSTVNYPLTLIDTAGVVKAAAQSRISGISSGGWTSIGSGLLDGQNELNLRGDNSHAWALILLSDGYDNTPPYASDILGQIPEKTDIYTIALGSDSDQSLLQSIASQTGGLYFMAPTADQLLGIYNMIRGKITGEQNIASISGQVSHGQTFSSTVEMDNTISEATFSLGWQNGHLALTLESPDGSVIDSILASSDPDIDFVQGPTYEYYTVRSPMYGTWSLDISDTDISPSPINYTASVSAVTDLTVDAHFYCERSEVGQPITVLISIVEGSTPMLGAGVKAIIQSPGMSLSQWGHSTEDPAPRTSWQSSMSDTLELYDDGVHGDGYANDGVYGNYYLSTQISGSYLFRFDISGITTGGIQFTRVAESSMFLQPASGQGTISGTVLYPGAQEGQIYVRAWGDNPTLSGIPDYIIDVTDSLYLLDDLTDAMYTLDAYMDVDGDGGHDMSEPYGQADSLITIYGAVYRENINITMADPELEIAVSPNPYVPARGHSRISFFGSGLPFSKISIFNKAGHLVQTLEENGGKDRLDWDVKNSDGHHLASGVYIWVSTNSQGKNHKGKFSIIQ
jgi:Mg-chelatase subunit ChlD